MKRCEFRRCENMTELRFIIFASGGNDSIALVQWAFENGYKGVAVAYSDTGWAASWWPLRMSRFQKWVISLGFSFHTIASEGMESLIDRKSAFPANGMQFCTSELKLKPAQVWLDWIDPDKNADCVIGIRREESAKRRNWPRITPDSENHGGRDLIAPLIDHTTKMRDELIRRAGWEPLPYRSKECSPCVNLSRIDGRLLEEPEIARVERIEKRTGLTMFRPKRFRAKGIREVVRWANSAPGKFNTNQPDLEMSGCDSGMCGD